jgi:pentatricopeptide repeat protein
LDADQVFIQAQRRNRKRAESVLIRAHQDYPHHPSIPVLIDAIECPSLAFVNRFLPNDCGEAEKISWIRRLQRRALEHQVSPIGANFLFSRLVREAKDFDEAREWQELLSRDFAHPNVVTFSSLLSKAPDWAAARAVQEEMKEAGLKPNEVTFNSLLSKAPDWAAARAVLEEMKEAGLKPNEVTFSSLLSKAPDWAAARGVLEEMKEAGLKPDEVTFNALAHRADTPFQAHEALDMLTAAGFRLSGFSWSALLRHRPALGEEAEILAQWLTWAKSPRRHTAREVQALQRAVRFSARRRRSRDERSALLLVLEHTGWIEDFFGVLTEEWDDLDF